MTSEERVRFELVLSRHLIRLGTVCPGMIIWEQYSDGTTRKVVISFVDWESRSVRTEGLDGSPFRDLLSMLGKVRSVRIDSTADVNGGPIMQAVLKATPREADAAALYRLHCTHGAAEGEALWRNGKDWKDWFSEYRYFAEVAGELLLERLGVDWRTAVLTGGEPSDPLADDEGDESGGAA